MRVIEWVGSNELPVLAGTLLVVVGTWLFIAIADEVREGETHHFDKWAITALRDPDDRKTPLGPPWVQEIARDVTALGGNVVIGLVILAVSGFLLLDKKTGALAAVLGATLSGWIVTALLKAMFNRPRPDVELHLTTVSTTSFPSGHSMMSAVVYLTLGALMAQLMARKRLKFYCLAVAAFLTLMVGLSRVYLGVHYPSDVLAGWSAGLAWATGCWLVFHYLQKRGQVEKPT